MEERNAASPGEPPDRESDADETAMAGHPAFPHPEQDEWLVDQQVEVIEEEIADPASDEHSHDQGEDKIRHLIGRKGGAAGACVADHQPSSGQKTADVSQSVPADADISPKVDEKRAQIIDPIGERREHVRFRMCDCGLNGDGQRGAGSDRCAQVEAGFSVGKGPAV